MSEIQIPNLRSASQAFLRFSDAEKKKFLAEFISEMTVEVRGFYSQGATAANKRFERWNELEHRLIGNLAAMLRDSDERYPDDVLIKLIQSAADDGLGKEISWALTRAFDRAGVPRKTNTRKTASAR